jgi:thioesterase domain-containing protein/acyl carrier protein
MRPLEEFLSELRRREIILWLDGERLRYRAPENSLDPTDLSELRERKAEIIAFLQAAKQLISDNQLPLHPISREGYLPLSFAQQRFWFLYQFEPDSPANNVPVVVRFTGNLDLDVLNRSITTVARRHEVLRSRFPLVDGQPVLVIDPKFEVELPIVDLQVIPNYQQEAETHRIITKDARQPFDLEKGPLLRVTLFRLSAQEHLLLWNMPCIICDGTSSDLFYRELTTCYVAYATGKSPDLPELPIQYADFAHWQRQYLQGEVLDSHLNYWQQQLSGNLVSLQLPTDYPRSSGLRTCRGDRYARMLPKLLHQDLLTLSQQLGTTLFVVLLATFDVLLHRYSQQDDILTTFVSSGRNRVETENLIGFFSNTLILRTHFDQELTFRELVQRIHRQNLDAYTHQELPFERLVDALSPEQRQGRSPLFQTKFTLNPPWTNGQGMAVVKLPDLQIESLFGYIYHGKTKYDLILVTREQDQGLGAVIDYNAELFAEETMERMMGHFQTLLESIIVNPDQAITTMLLLTPSEQQLLAAWSRRERDLSAICSTTVSNLQANSNPEGLFKPLANVQAYLLDRYLQLVPIGVPGELYLGGEGLDQGNLNPDLMNLIPNPFSNGSTIQLYPTGKWARYSPESHLEFIDQNDNSALKSTSSNTSRKLPDNTFRDVIEQQLTQIWQGLLGLEGINVQDNFFDLGGHSLLAVRLFAEIETAFNKQLPLSVLLQAPTIEQLANVLRSEVSSDLWSPLVAIQPQGTKPPLFCIHGGGFNVLVYRHLAINLGVDQPVYGLEARDYDPEKGILDSMEALAISYVREIQRVQPKGPYLLAGLSNGGNIALEMAQHLQAQGHQVALLAMFDSYGPNGIKLLPPLHRFLSSLKYVLQHTLPRTIAKIWRSPLSSLLTGVRETVKNLGQFNNSSASHSSTPSKAQQTNQNAANVRRSTSGYNKLEQRMNQVSQYILEHSPWSFFTPTVQLKEMNDVVSTMLKKMEESYSNLHKAYQPECYEGKIILFRAMECPPGYWLEPYLGWSQIALSGVEVHKIPGHHTSLMESVLLGKKMSIAIQAALENANLSTKEPSLTFQKVSSGSETSQGVAQ